MFALKSSFVLARILFVASLLLVTLPCSSAAAVGQSQAVSALEDADRIVVAAYQAVSNASAAGANVTGLLVRLNEAGVLLTRAHAACGQGDFDSALELADLCQERLVGFVADANALTEAAVRDRNLDFLVNVVLSIVGSVGVVWFGFFVWFYLDRRYGKAGGQVQ